MGTIPNGWRRIDAYWTECGFHHVRFLRYRLDGSAAEFKTRRADYGRELAEAYRRGVPVVLVTQAEWILDVGILPPDYDAPDRDAVSASEVR